RTFSYEDKTRRSPAHSELSIQELGALLFPSRFDEVAMRHLLLLIAGESVVHLDGSLGFLSREHGFDCRREVWDAASPPSLFQRSWDVVLFAAGNEGRPDSFLRWLRGHPLNAPVVAILPQDCDEDTLRPAAEVVDDFIFSPVHGEELQCRLERI